MSASRFFTIASAVLAVVLQAGVARAEIKTQWVEYKEGDTALRGYLAYDDATTGKRPGVLLPTTAPACPRSRLATRR